MIYNCKVRDDGVITLATADPKERPAWPTYDLPDGQLMDARGRYRWRVVDGAVVSALTKNDLAIDEEAALHSYLASTDWAVIREIETGKKMDDEMKNKRQVARDRISEIRAKWANSPTLENA